MNKSDLIELLKKSIEDYGDDIVVIDADGQWLELLATFEWLELLATFDMWDCGVPDREAGDAAGKPGAIILTPYE